METSSYLTTGYSKNQHYYTAEISDSYMVLPQTLLLTYTNVYS